MYLEHFGLRELPFGITPHTGFFFAGAGRGAMLEALVYAVVHDEGIIEVSGEVGSGKTMLCRMLLERLPECVETVCLATPSLSREDILQAIADELRVEPSGSGGHRMMRSLQDRLLQLHAAGRRIVVIVDEAHAMPAETLEEIRLLSNLESSRHKLLHIVLFGQPELDERLGRTDMRQLRERITHHFTLGPLRHVDVGDYLAFRLHAAGYRGPDPFTPLAVRLIAWASGGLTRRINILADKSLLAAFADGRRRAGVRQARAAIRDARFLPMAGKRRKILAIAALSAVVAVAAIALSSVFWLHAPFPPVFGGASPSLSVEVPPESGTQTLGERIAATGEWLKGAPRTHYVIQLLDTDAGNFSGVLRLLDELAARLDPREIRVHRSRARGGDRLLVIYGDYPARATARADLEKLSRISPAGAPGLRSVGSLK